MLNMATFINIVAAIGSSKRTKVTGSKGKRIDFSCTWKENKKNPKDELIIAYKKRFFEGAIPK